MNDLLRGTLVHDDPRQWLTPRQRNRLGAAFEDSGMIDALCCVTREMPLDILDQARTQLTNAALSCLAAAGIGLYEVFPELDPRPATEAQRLALGMIKGFGEPVAPEVWLTESKSKYLIVRAQECAT